MLLRQIGKNNQIIVYEKSNNNNYYLVGNNLPTECTESYWISNG